MKLPGFWILSLICLTIFAKSIADEPRVVCYYTNWSIYRPGTAKYSPQNINPYLCTHLIYAFGGFTKDSTLQPFDKYQDIEKGGYAKFTGLKTYNKNLKTLLAIGGWNEASSRFSPLVGDAERRRKFVKNAIKYLRQNHFDGLDLDWEYPTFRDGGKPKDKVNYAQFVQELREEFDRESSKTGRPRLLLTLAIPAGVDKIEQGYDVVKLNQYLDWFNVLTYDYHDSFEPATNHHAPLYSLEEDDEYNYDSELNIDYSVKHLINAGADRQKLILGIPTYGRSYTLFNADANEIGAPTDGPGEPGDATREKGFLAYYEICQSIKSGEDWTVMHPNDNVMGPYLYKDDQWISYDDENMARKKAQYVAKNGLGGIMFWSIDTDDFRGECSGKPYPLIEAAKEGLYNALGVKQIETKATPVKSTSRNRPRPTKKPIASNEATSSVKDNFTRRRKPTQSRTTAEPTKSAIVYNSRTTTPQPPTTPDPGSDFKCEEEGFFSHPRDCKKYFWCLDSGPANLGIVAHQFTCPSGLVFNKQADSCDYARNVHCEKAKDSTTTTAAPTTKLSTQRTTTFRTTTSRPTTTTTPEYEDDEEEYEDDELEPERDIEDPKVIKELIDLIKKAGGLDNLEKHLKISEDNLSVYGVTKSDKLSTTPATFSKSLYDKVLIRKPGNRFVKTEDTNKVKSDREVVSVTPKVNNTRYSSVYRNSRPSPQNAGLEEVADFDAFLKEKPQYVTIQRHRTTTTAREDSGEEDIEDEDEDGYSTTQTSYQVTAQPQYVSIQRNRGTTVSTASGEVESDEVVENTFSRPVESGTPRPQYTSINRGRRPENIASDEVTEPAKLYGPINRGGRPSSNDADDTESAIKYSTISRDKTPETPLEVSSGTESSTQYTTINGRRRPDGDKATSSQTETESIQYTSINRRRRPENSDTAETTTLPETETTTTKYTSFNRRRKPDTTEEPETETTTQYTTINSRRRPDNSKTSNKSSVSETESNVQTDEVINSVKTRTQTRYQSISRGSAAAPPSDNVQEDENINSEPISTEKYSDSHEQKGEDVEVSTKRVLPALLNSNTKYQTITRNQIKTTILETTTADEINHPQNTTTDLLANNVTQKETHPATPDINNNLIGFHINHTNNELTTQLNQIDQTSQNHSNINITANEINNDITFTLKSEQHSSLNDTFDLNDVHANTIENVTEFIATKLSSPRPFGFQKPTTKTILLNPTRAPKVSEVENLETNKTISSPSNNDPAINGTTQQLDVKPLVDRRRLRISSSTNPEISSQTLLESQNTITNLDADDTAGKATLRPTLNRRRNRISTSTNGNSNSGYEQTTSQGSSSLGERRGFRISTSSKLDTSQEVTHNPSSSRRGFRGSTSTTSNPPIESFDRSGFRISSAPSANEINSELSTHNQILRESDETNLKLNVTKEEEIIKPSPNRRGFRITSANKPILVNESETSDTSNIDSTTHFAIVSEQALSSSQSAVTTSNPLTEIEKAMIAGDFTTLEPKLESSTDNRESYKISSFTTPNVEITTNFEQTTIPEKIESRSQISVNEVSPSITSNLDSTTVFDQTTVGQTLNNWHETRRGHRISSSTTSNLDSTINFGQTSSSNEIETNGSPTNFAGLNSIIDIGQGSISSQNVLESQNLTFDLSKNDTTTLKSLGASINSGSFKISSVTTPNMESTSDIEQTTVSKNFELVSEVGTKKSLGNRTGFRVSSSTTPNLDSTTVVDRTEEEIIKPSPNRHGFRITSSNIPTLVNESDTNEASIQKLKLNSNNTASFKISYSTAPNIDSTTDFTTVSEQVLSSSQSAITSSNPLTEIKKAMIAGDFTTLEPKLETSTDSKESYKISSFTTPNVEITTDFEQTTTTEKNENGSQSLENGLGPKIIITEESPSTTSNLDSTTMFDQTTVGQTLNSWHETRRGHRISSSTTSNLDSTTNLSPLQTSSGTTNLATGSNSISDIGQGSISSQRVLETQNLTTDLSENDTTTLKSLESSIKRGSFKISSFQTSNIGSTPDFEQTTVSKNFGIGSQEGTRKSIGTGFRVASSTTPILDSTTVVDQTLLGSQTLETDLGAQIRNHKETITSAVDRRGNRISSVITSPNLDSTPDFEQTTVSKNFEHGSQEGTRKSLGTEYRVSSPTTPNLDSTTVVDQTLLGSQTLATDLGVQIRNHKETITSSGDRRGNRIFSVITSPNLDSTPDFEQTTVSKNFELGSQEGTRKSLGTGFRVSSSTTPNLDSTTVVDQTLLGSQTLATDLGAQIHNHKETITTTVDRRGNRISSVTSSNLDSTPDFEQTTVSKNVDLGSQEGTRKSLGTGFRVSSSTTPNLDSTTVVDQTLLGSQTLATDLGGQIRNHKETITSMVDRRGNRISSVTSSNLDSTPDFEQTTVSKNFELGSQEGTRKSLGTGFRVSSSTTPNLDSTTVVDQTLLGSQTLATDLGAQIHNHKETITTTVDRRGNRISSVTSSNLDSTPDFEQTTVSKNFDLGSQEGTRKSLGTGFRVSSSTTPNLDSTTVVDQTLLGSQTLATDLGVQIRNQEETITSSVDRRGNRISSVTSPNLDSTPDFEQTTVSKNFELGSQEGTRKSLGTGFRVSSSTTPNLDSTTVVDQTLLGSQTLATDLGAQIHNHKETITTTVDRRGNRISSVTSSNLDSTPDFEQTTVSKNFDLGSQEGTRKSLGTGFRVSSSTTPNLDSTTVVDQTLLGSQTLATDLGVQIRNQEETITSSVDRRGNRISSVTSPNLDSTPDFEQTTVSKNFELGSQEGTRKSLGTGFRVSSSTTPNLDSTTVVDQTLLGSQTLETDLGVQIRNHKKTITSTVDRRGNRFSSVTSPNLDSTPDFEQTTVSENNEVGSERYDIGSKISTQKKTLQFSDNIEEFKILSSTTPNVYSTTDFDQTTVSDQMLLDTQTSESDLGAKIRNQEETITSSVDTTGYKIVSVTEPNLDSTTNFEQTTVSEKIELGSQSLVSISDSKIIVQGNRLQSPDNIEEFRMLSSTTTTPNLESTTDFDQTTTPEQISVDRRGYRISSATSSNLDSTTVFDQTTISEPTIIHTDQDTSRLEPLFKPLINRTSSRISTSTTPNVEFTTSNGRRRFRISSSTISNIDSTSNQDAHSSETDLSLKLNNQEETVTSSHDRRGYRISSARRPTLGSTTEYDQTTTSERPEILSSSVDRRGFRISSSSNTNSNGEPNSKPVINRGRFRISTSTTPNLESTTNFDQTTASENNSFSSQKDDTLRSSGDRRRFRIASSTISNIDSTTNSDEITGTLISSGNRRGYRISTSTSPNVGSTTNYEQSTTSQNSDSRILNPVTLSSQTVPESQNLLFSLNANHTTIHESEIKSTVDREGLGISNSTNPNSVALEFSTKPSGTDFDQTTISNQTLLDSQTESEIEIEPLTNSVNDLDVTTVYDKTTIESQSTPVNLGSPNTRVDLEQTTAFNTTPLDKSTKVELEQTSISNKTFIRRTFKRPVLRNQSTTNTNTDTEIKQETVSSNFEENDSATQASKLKPSFGRPGFKISSTTVPSQVQDLEKITISSQTILESENSGTNVNIKGSKFKSSFSRPTFNVSPATSPSPINDTEQATISSQNQESIPKSNIDRRRFKSSSPTTRPTVLVTERTTTPSQNTPEPRIPPPRTIIRTRGSIKFHTRTTTEATEIYENSPNRNNITRKYRPVIEETSEAVNYNTLLDRNTRPEVLDELSSLTSFDFNRQNYNSRDRAVRRRPRPTVITSTTTQETETSTTTQNQETSSSAVTGFTRKTLNTRLPVIRRRPRPTVVTSTTTEEISPISTESVSSTESGTATENSEISSSTVNDFTRNTLNTRPSVIIRRPRPTEVTSTTTEDITPISIESVNSTESGTATENSEISSSTVNDFTRKTLNTRPSVIIRRPRPTEVTSTTTEDISPMSIESVNSTESGTTTEHSEFRSSTVDDFTRKTLNTRPSVIIRRPRPTEITSTISEDISPVSTESVNSTESGTTMEDSEFSSSSVNGFTRKTLNTRLPVIRRRPRPTEVTNTTTQEINSTSNETISSTESGTTTEEADNTENSSSTANDLTRKTFNGRVPAIRRGSRPTFAPRTTTRTIESESDSEIGDLEDVSDVPNRNNLIRKYRPGKEEQTEEQKQAVDYNALLDRKVRPINLDELSSLTSYDFSRKANSNGNPAVRRRPRPTVGTTSTTTEEISSTTLSEPEVSTGGSRAYKRPVSQFLYTRLPENLSNPVENSQNNSSQVDTPNETTPESRTDTPVTLSLSKSLDFGYASKKPSSAVKTVFDDGFESISKTTSHVTTELNDDTTSFSTETILQTTDDTTTAQDSLSVTTDFNQTTFNDNVTNPIQNVSDSVTLRPKPKSRVRTVKRLRDPVKLLNSTIESTNEITGTGSTENQTAINFSISDPTTTTITTTTVIETIANEGFNFQTIDNQTESASIAGRRKFQSRISTTPGTVITAESSSEVVNQESGLNGGVKNTSRFGLANRTFRRRPSATKLEAKSNDTLDNENVESSVQTEPTPQSRTRVQSNSNSQGTSRFVARTRRPIKKLDVATDKGVNADEIEPEVEEELETSSQKSSFIPARRGFRQRISPTSTTVSIQSTAETDNQVSENVTSTSGPRSTVRPRFKITRRPFTQLEVTSEPLDAAEIDTSTPSRRSFASRFSQSQRPSNPSGFNVRTSTRKPTTDEPDDNSNDNLPVSDEQLDPAIVESTTEARRKFGSRPFATRATVTAQINDETVSEIESSVQNDTSTLPRRKFVSRVSTTSASPNENSANIKPINASRYNLGNRTRGLPTKSTTEVATDDKTEENENNTEENVAADLQVNTDSNIISTTLEDDSTDVNMPTSTEELKSTTVQNTTVKPRRKVKIIKGTRRPAIKVTSTESVNAEENSEASTLLPKLEINAADEDNLPLDDKESEFDALKTAEFENNTSTSASRLKVPNRTFIRRPVTQPGTVDKDADSNGKNETSIQSKRTYISRTSATQTNSESGGQANGARFKVRAFTRNPVQNESDDDDIDQEESIAFDSKEIRSNNQLESSAPIRRPFNARLSTTPRTLHTPTNGETENSTSNGAPRFKVFNGTFTRKPISLEASVNGTVDEDVESSSQSDTSTQATRSPIRLPGNRVRTFTRKPTTAEPIEDDVNSDENVPLDNEEIELNDQQGPSTTTRRTFRPRIPTALGRKPVTAKPIEDDINSEENVQSEDEEIESNVQPGSSTTTRRTFRPRIFTTPSSISKQTEENSPGDEEINSNGQSRRTYISRTSASESNSEVNLNAARVPGNRIRAFTRKPTTAEPNDDDVNSGEDVPSDDEEIDSNVQLGPSTTTRRTFRPNIFKTPSSLNKQVNINEEQPEEILPGDEEIESNGQSRRTYISKTSAAESNSETSQNSAKAPGYRVRAFTRKPTTAEPIDDDVNSEENVPSDNEDIETNDQPGSSTTTRRTFRPRIFTTPSTINHTNSTDGQSENQESLNIQKIPGYRVRTVIKKPTTTSEPIDEEVISEETVTSSSGEVESNTELDSTMPSIENNQTKEDAEFVISENLDSTTIENNENVESSTGSEEEIESNTKLSENFNSTGTVDEDNTEDSTTVDNEELEFNTQPTVQFIENNQATSEDDEETNAQSNTSTTTRRTFRPNISTNKTSEDTEIGVSEKLNSTVGPTFKLFNRTTRKPLTRLEVTSDGTDNEDIPQENLSVNDEDDESIGNPISSTTTRRTFRPRIFTTKSSINNETNETEVNENEDEDGKINISTQSRRTYISRTSAVETTSETESKVPAYKLRTFTRKPVTNAPEDEDDDNEENNPSDNEEINSATPIRKPFSPRVSTTSSNTESEIRISQNANPVKYNLINRTRKPFGQQPNINDNNSDELDEDDAELDRNTQNDEVTEKRKYVSRITTTTAPPPPRFKVFSRPSTRKPSTTTTEENFYDSDDDDEEDDDNAEENFDDEEIDGNSQKEPDNVNIRLPIPSYKTFDRSSTKRPFVRPGINEPEHNENIEDSEELDSNSQTGIRYPSRTFGIQSNSETETRVSGSTNSFGPPRYGVINRTRKPFTKPEINNNDDNSEENLFSDNEGSKSNTPNDPAIQVRPKFVPRVSNTPAVVNSGGGPRVTGNVPTRFRPAPPRPSPKLVINANIDDEDGNEEYDEEDDRFEQNLTGDDESGSTYNKFETSSQTIRKFKPGQSVNSIQLKTQTSSESSLPAGYRNKSIFQRKPYIKPVYTKEGSDSDNEETTNTEEDLIETTTMGDFIPESETLPTLNNILTQTSNSSEQTNSSTNVDRGSHIVDYKNETDGEYELHKNDLDAGLVIKAPVIPSSASAPKIVNKPIARTLNNFSKLQSTQTSTGLKNSPVQSIKIDSKYVPFHLRQQQNTFNKQNGFLTTTSPKASQEEIETTTESLSYTDYTNIQHSTTLDTTTPIPSSIEDINLFSTLLSQDSTTMVSDEDVEKATDISISLLKYSKPTTTSKPTTLHHIFAVDYDSVEEDRNNGTKLGNGTAVNFNTDDSSKEASAEEISLRLEKLVEINRIVEIYSKQQKNGHNDLSANSNELILEQIPTLDKIGEISRWISVKLQNHNSSSSSSTNKFQEILNNITQLASGGDLTANTTFNSKMVFDVETSTIPLEGLFDKNKKKLNENEVVVYEVTKPVVTPVPYIPLPVVPLQQIDDNPKNLDSFAGATSFGLAAATIPSHNYVQQLRPESHEANPLVISIANLDQVVLTKNDKIEKIISFPSVISTTTTEPPPNQLTFSSSNLDLTN